MRKAIIASVPTELKREPYGPLTLDEIDQSAALMDRLAAEVAAARETS